MISKFIDMRIDLLHEIQKFICKICHVSYKCYAECPLYGNRRLCEFLHSNSHIKYMSEGEIQARENEFRVCIANYLLKVDEND